MNGDIIPSR